MISALVGLALAASGGASAGVDLRAGYDSNLFFGAVQDLAIEPQSTNDALGTVHDSFVAVRPRLLGNLQLGRLALGADAEASVTQYAQYAHGYYRVLRASLSQTLALGRYTLGLEELGDDYAISAFRSDHLQRALAGLDGGVALGALELGLRVEGGVRHFPARESAYQVLENDTVLAATLVARFLAGPFTLDGSLRGESRGSNAATAAGNLELLELGGTWSRGALDLALHLDGRRLALPSFPVTDLAVGRQDLEVLAHAELAYHWGAFSPGLEASFERNVSNYGLVIFSRAVAAVDFSWRYGWSPPPHALAAPLPDRPGRYRLELELPNAKSVLIVGSFQGWRAPGVPLTETRPGHFAVELDLPTGRYRYQLIVDGVRLAPPDADGYEPDGMGGTDAVLNVSDASNQGAVR